MWSPVQTRDWALCSEKWSGVKWSGLCHWGMVAPATLYPWGVERCKMASGHKKLTWWQQCGALNFRLRDNEPNITNRFIGTMNFQTGSMCPGVRQYTDANSYPRNVWKRVALMKMKNENNKASSGLEVGSMKMKIISLLRIRSWVMAVEWNSPVMWLI